MYKHQTVDHSGQGESVLILTMVVLIVFNNNGAQMKQVLVVFFNPFHVWSDENKSPCCNLQGTLENVEFLETLEFRRSRIQLVGPEICLI